jgi:hypothetical protein
MTNIISIVPRAEERTAQLASAFTRFEGRLCNLHCMAQLAFDAVQELDGPRRPSDDELNLAIFSVHHLFEMIADTKAAWYRDWEASGNDDEAVS